MPSFRRHRGAEALIGLVRQSGLCGRGGANFPTAQKLAAVASRRGHRVVVANGCEGEPASAKDKVLLAQAPHLVLDGLLIAAQAVGANRLILTTTSTVAPLVEAALRERAAQRVDHWRPDVVVVPERFISGEASALVNFLDGGPGLPTFVPPRPDQRGVGGRPTLVQNVETLAHLALIARNGAAWFRQVGTEDDPGSTLVTLRGAVRRPGVYEIARGSSLNELLYAAGGVSMPVQALLLGGYGGTWLQGDGGTRLGEAVLRSQGATLGAGVVYAFPQGRCGVAETARILNYLARESAGQCGPCANGLPAMARAMDELARGLARKDVVQRLELWAWQVAGRGACHHPDGAVRMLKTALSVFADDVVSHRDGRSCRALPGPAPGGVATQVPAPLARQASLSGRGGW